MYTINLTFNILASSFLIFCLGTTIGSFLNVLIDRIPKDQSFIKGRSYCDHCKKKLQWFDLIPLLSFVFLKRKCRYCRQKISFYYPMVEFTTGILFVLTFYWCYKEIFQLSTFNFQLNQLFPFLYYLFIVSSLIIIFFTDIKYGIIPDKIIYPAILVSFLTLFTSKESWLSLSLQPATFEVLINYLFSAIATFIFFFSIFLFTKGKGMGFGDVKLSFLMGLLLGFPKIIAALYVAFLTGAAVSLILIICRKRKFFGGTIPFGPFLVIGTIASIFWGDFILQLIFPFPLH